MVRAPRRDGAAEPVASRRQRASTARGRLHWTPASSPRSSRSSSAGRSIAADDLGVTQPAVSLAVRSLEKRSAPACSTAPPPGRSDRGGPRGADPRPAHARARAGAGRHPARRGRHRRRASRHRRLTGPARARCRGCSSASAAYPEATAACASTRRRTGLIARRELELGVVGAERPHRSLSTSPSPPRSCSRRPATPSPDGRRDARRAPARADGAAAEGSGVRALTERELRNHGVCLR